MIFLGMIMAAICVMCMCAARQYPNLSYSKGVMEAATMVNHLTDSK